MIRGYLTEFRASPRPLIGAALGLGSGLGTAAFVSAIFVPHLMREFGWARSDFAMVGSAGTIVFLVLPLYGRLADIFGVRPVAIWGTLCQSACYAGFSLMTGHIGEYLVIFIVLLAGGCATTAAVYGRIIMERYSRARGLALAIVMSAAPLLGAIGAPMINGIVEDFGWRTAYRVVALVLGGLGLLGVALIPRDGETLKGMQKQGANLRDYPLFLRTSAFLIIFFAMTLNYMSQILNSSQLGLILSDNGASATTAARILSVYAIGVVVGRVFCGLALDRFRPHVVAAIIMAMPGIGQLLLASPFNSTAVLLISLLLMGLTTGAEGDISAFLVMKYFPEKIFGSVNSIVSAGAGAASGIGGIVLGLTFLVNPGFTLFLIIGATAVFAGSVLFLFLGRCRPLAAETVEAAMRQRDDIAAGRPQALT